MFRDDKEKKKMGRPRIHSTPAARNRSYKLRKRNISIEQHPLSFCLATFYVLQGQNVSESLELPFVSLNHFFEFYKTNTTAPVCGKDFVALLSALPYLELDRSSQIGNPQIRFRTAPKKLMNETENNKFTSELPNGQIAFFPNQKKLDEFVARVDLRPQGQETNG
jgi:hypothetical protein